MTSDPIADMLTRVRNAISGAPSQGGCSGFQLKAEIARHPQRRRLHRQLQGGGRSAKKTIKIYLKYGATTPR